MNQRRLLAAIALVAAACAPAAAPLRGVLAPERRLPELAVAPGHRLIAFKWEYEEGEIAARGEGTFRVAPPDSVRVDFFLGGGLGSGGAILIGESLRSAARQDLVKRYIPPAPLMWAVFNRLAIPALPDTVIRIEGDILRGDVGRPAEWRVTARGDSIVGLEHISGTRIAETLTKSGSSIFYEAPGARRKLRLTIVRQQEVGPFDASIWSL